MLTDTFLDVVKVIPFLFLTYLLMEWLEHKTEGRSQNLIKKAGKTGPVIGSLLGAFPQCGFSASGSTLYAGRVISLGTLMAIYLSTSDEMLPIMIAEKADAGFILKVIIIKVVIGIICGFITDYLIYPLKKHSAPVDIDNICKSASCGCKNEHKILKPAFLHTLKMGLFLFIITLIINAAFYFLNDSVKGVFFRMPFIENIISALVGLIPNCASSIAITKLYLEGVISFSAMLSGLLSSAGIGVLVLCKVNRHKKENAFIIGLLITFAVIFGFAAGLL